MTLERLTEIKRLAMGTSLSNLAARASALFHALKECIHEIERLQEEGER